MTAIMLIMVVNTSFATEHSSLDDINVFDDGFDPLSDENVDYSFRAMACPSSTISPACAQTTTTFNANTILAANDCGLRGSRDYVVRVNIPYDGSWTFETCGANFDTYIYLGTSCCGSQIASNDDACGLDSRVTATLSAGTYYLAVEAFGTGQTGTFPLNIIANSPIPGTGEPFGNNEWLVYGYNGNDYNTLHGFYNAGTDLSQTTFDHFPSGGNPSQAPTWQGCSLPNNQHSYRYKRRGFPCGDYQINITGHDDYAYLEVDGTTVWFHNGCCDTHSSVWSGTLDANSEVLFGLREFGGGSNLSFNIIQTGPPDNDLCVGAIPVNVNSSVSGNTAHPCYTADTEPFCGTSDGTGAGLWYSFTGTGNIVQVSTCGSSYDTKIRVYTGNCAAPTCVAGQDDACGLQTEFDFCTVSGTTYYVLVHGFGSNEGNFTLNVSGNIFPLSPGTHNSTNATGCVGYNPGNINASAASFGASAAEGGSTSYQWQSNGVDIPGATGEDYNPPAFNTAGTFAIRRKVTDQCGNVAYTGTKTYNIVADPSISLIASPSTICPGHTTTLTATTSGGSGTCSFTWQSSPNNSTWTTIVSNSNSSTFEVSPSTDTYYRVRRVCTGPGCNDPYSSSVFIDVNDDTDPVLNNCPSNITVNNTPGNCNATANWTEPTVTDNCYPVTFASGGNTFSFLGQYEDHIYYLSDIPLIPNGSSEPEQQAAFAEAHATAVSVGGYLATINDPGENAFITGMAGGSSVLIGLTDELVENSFGWIGGGGTGYFNWNGGEPNNAGDEDYVEIQGGSGGWNDINLFNSQRRFLIEINVMTSTHNPGDVFPVGTTTVTYTANDGTGNTATCSFDVTVNDTENPVASCTPYTANLGAGGSVSITAANVDGGSSDNCSIASMSVSPNTFNCSNLGPNTVTLTVTDIYGNSASCNTTVTVTDTNGECCDISLNGVAVVPETCDGDNDGSITINASCSSCASIQYSIGGGFQAGNTFSGLAPGAYNITIIDSSDPSCNATGSAAVNGSTAVSVNVINSNDVTCESGSDGAIDIEMEGGASSSVFDGIGNNGEYRVPSTPEIESTVNNMTLEMWLYPTTFSNRQNPIAKAYAGEFTITQETNGTLNLYYGNLGINGGAGNVNYDAFNTNTSLNLNQWNHIAVVRDMDRNQLRWYVNGEMTRIENSVPIPPAPGGNDVIIGNGYTNPYNGKIDEIRIWNTPMDLETINEWRCRQVDPSHPSFGSLVAYWNFDQGDPVVALDQGAVGNANGNPTNPVTLSENDITCLSPAVGETYAWSNGATSEDIAGLAAGPYTVTVTTANGCTATASVTISEPTPITVSETITDALCNGDSNGEIDITPSGGTENYTISTNGAQSGIITIPTNDDLDFDNTDDFTIATWIRHDPAQPNTGATTNAAISKWLSSGSYPFVIRVGNQTGSNGAIFCRTYDGVNNPGVNSVGTPLIDGQWHHIAFTKSGNTYTLYVDGVLDNTGSGTLTGSIKNDDPIVIGGRPTTRFYKGDFDNIAFFPTALPPGDIMNLMCEPQGLVPLSSAFYDFNEGAGSNADDISNNVHDATLGGATTYQLDTEICKNPGEPYIYNWSTGATTEDVTGLAAGTYTVTVTDAAGCIYTESFVVNEPTPLVVTIAPPIDLDCNTTSQTLTANGSGGTGTIDYAWSAGGGGNITSGGATATPVVNAEGTYTVTITDDNSCTETASVFVDYIDDTTNPTISCPANITTNIDAGTCGALVTYAAPTSTDNCPGETIAQTAGLASGATFPLGITINTFVVTDASGNTATCSFTVTVIDNEDPVISCPANIAANNDLGICGAVVTYTTPSGTDNCPGQTTTQTAGLPSGATFPVGTTTNTFVVTDAAGNTATCSFTVTISDTENPAASCANITIQLDATGNASITPNDIGSGSTDNCAVDNMTLNVSSFTCAQIGNNTVTLTVFDAAGNSSTCTGTVTVEDNIAPTITCPANISVDTDAGQCYATVTYTPPVGVDNCTGSTTVQIAGLPSGATFPVGTTTNTFEVTDVAGNTAQCSFDVIVTDNEPPTLVCQDATLTLDASGIVGITNANIVTTSFGDACGFGNISYSQSAFDCSHAGTTIPVTVTAVDVNGNSSTCVSNVTIVDNIVPTAVCQNITVQLDASGSVTVNPADVDNGSSDNCTAPLTFALSQTTFGCAEIGSNAVTLTVTDAAGNTSTCNATITVVDNINPTAVCQNITVQLNAAGTANIVAGDVDGGSTDACGTPTLSIDVNSFNCTNIGTNVVTLTVTDASGNTDNCTSTVTVEDNVPPTPVCQNITVQLDALGNATITAADIDNGSNDACGISGISVNQTAFDCTHLGVNNVVLTVTDNNGNTATCNATVTVVDNVNPTAVCQNITIQLDASGNASITPNQIDNGSADACGAPTLSLDITSFDCTDLGTNTVTLTATDGSGNTATCTATVTVEDNTNPVAICQNITVQLDATGNVSIVAADVDGGSTDACGTPSLSIDTNAFDCSDVGANSVTLTATDGSGNASTCIATVTVEDNIPPTPVCQNITVQLDASGNATITAAQVDNGSSDNCGVASLALDNTTFNCSNIGANTVTLTVTDDNGNTATCTATVTIEDNVNPTAICQDITVQLDATGNVTITPAQIDNGSSDACGIASLALNQTNFDCTNVGNNTVVLTVTDNNGNTATCSATVTVQDNVNPTALCQNVTIQLDATGNASITTADIDNGSADNCGNVSLALDNTTFDCSNVGPNTVTLTVTDDNGNASTCQATVTVQDNINPTAICQDITIQLDATGNASITTADIDNGSNDNCGIASLALDNTAFNCSNVGANTVTLTVTDVNGNTSTCTATVTVQDIINPTAICQDITVQLDATGNVSITTADIDNGSNDNCGIASLALSQTAFDCNDVGINNVTLTVTDNNGNVSTCTANVTVEDNINPTALCQNVTIQLDATGNASITTADIDNGSADNCGNVSLALDNTTFDCTNVGPNTVTLTVTDDNGNVSTCQATVTVQDNINPTAICQNIVVQLDATGNASITTADIDNGSNDNCGIASLALDNTTFNCSNVGANTVTLTVTDVNGNTSTCTATVTVQDNVNPNAICQDITVQLDAMGNVSITTADIDNGSNDNCGIASLALDITSFDCNDVGPNTVTLTVTDVNGNVSNCTSTVTVQDNVNPIAVCQDITVQLDATGNASIVPNDVDNGSSDACGTPTLSLDITSFDCTNIGPNTVTLTATDANGNTATCQAIVTIEDNVNPTAICQDITVQLDATGNISITEADIDNGSNDACGIASLALNITSFDCTDVGPNTVSLTVTDNNGNSSICTATVTVEDNINPTAICQDITVQLDATGNASITPNQIDNGSNDNCNIANLALDITTFDCTNVGANTVTLTVTDDNGNTDNCSATVTIEDNVDPVAICQDIIVQLDAAGNATITTADIDNGSSDACGTPSLALDITSFDCTNVGPNIVTLTATDANGNTASCTSTVTVQDNVNPVAICQDVTIQLDASGNASITTTDIDNGSNDACGIASLALDNTSFDCTNVGNNTVTLTVTDNNGNVSTCTATVTVEDNVNPTAICQDITVQLDATGNASITPNQIDNGSNDNCGIANLALDITTFNCTNVGPNTVTLTVTDDNGNTSNCTATVTIEDNVAPVAVCQDITIQLDAAGNASITPAQIDNGSSDACSTPSLALDITTFDCTNVGPNTVTLTATDINGNSSTCTSTVTVQDNTSPVLTGCPSDITQGANTGNCTAIVNWTPPTGGDNCNGFTLTSTHNPLDAFPEGITTVTYTLTDASGNAVTCSFNVEVTGGIGSLDITTTENSGTTANDNIICETETATLDAGAGYVFYSWSTGANTQSINVTTGGTYQVTVTNANGCTATDTETITALDMPTASLTCPDPVVRDCEGRFNCMPMDLNTATLPVVTGAFSGSAAQYIIGNGTPGTDAFFDFNLMPKDTPLELIYTLTTPDGCSNSASCTFTIEGKKANPGRF